MNRVRLVYTILLSMCVGGTLIVLGVARKTKMKLTSEAFEYGGRIPKQYTCDAGVALNESPPLIISGVSKRAKSLVIIADNPESEAGVWPFWVVFNLPPTTTFLPVGADITKLGGVVGKNELGDNEYTGPCPGVKQKPYYFRLYALDTMLDLDEKATSKDVQAAMDGHIIAQTDLMGKYERAYRGGLG